MASDLETLTTFFAEQGVSEPGNSLHSWRCEYPDRYGECACVEEMITGLLSSDWLRERDRRIKAEALREFADEERDQMSAAWGGGVHWLTTGDKVATLAQGWVRERADRIASGGQA